MTNADREKLVEMLSESTNHKFKEMQYFIAHTRDMSEILEKFSKFETGPGNNRVQKV